MTNDKGAGEVPYTFYERADGRFMIEGPGIFTDFASEHLTRNEVHRLNMVFALGAQRGFAAGRKAERERCINIIRNHVDRKDGIISSYYLETVIDLLRGGQDGK